jgi:hypothetical protein
MPACKYCGLPIRYVKSAWTGFIVALDEKPDSTGDMIVFEGQAYRIFGGLYEQNPEGERYTQHNGTCKKLPR